jgi:hypothetical protein
MLKVGNKELLAFVFILQILQHSFSTKFLADDFFRASRKACIYARIHGFYTYRYVSYVTVQSLGKKHHEHD